MAPTSRPFRPLFFAFDPIPTSLAAPALDFLSLFEKHDDENAISLDPESMGVPRNTSLPWTRQSRHWAYAEAEARDMLNKISLDKASKRGTFPMEMEGDRRFQKIDELVEDGISCIAYLYPTSTPRRLELLTKAVILLFLHDDVIERGDTKDDTTVVDEFLTMKPKNEHIKQFFSDVLETDPVRGPPLLRAIRSFVHDGRAQSPFNQNKYWQLSDYMVYRRNDVGKEFMLAAIMFGCGADLTPSEFKPIDELADLYVRHSILINDLYPYNKEQYEVKAVDASIVNAVAVVEELLSISPD